MKNSLERTFFGDHHGVNSMKIDRIISKERMAKNIIEKTATQTYGDSGTVFSASIQGLDGGYDLSSTI